MRWVRRYPARAGLIGASAAALLALVALGVGLAYQNQLRSTNAELATANSDLEQAQAELETTNKSLTSVNDQLRHTKGELENTVDSLATTNQQLGQAKEALEASNDKLAVSLANEEHLQYFRRVSLAMMAWKDGEPERARQLLDECDPRHRHWEWSYVHRLCHPDRFTIKGHGDYVSCVSFSPDGTRLASGSRDHTIKIWNADTSEELRTIDAPESVIDLAYSPLGTTIASVCINKTIYLWDAEAGEQLRQFEGHTGLIGRLAFRPDGKRIASGANDGIRVWNVETGEQHSLNYSTCSRRPTWRSQSSVGGVG